METGVLKKDTDYICLCVPDNKTVVNAVVANTTTNSSAYATVTTPSPIYTLWNWTNTLSETCITSTGKVAVQPGCLTKDVCYEHGWATEGPACDDHNVVENIPNVFLLSCFLFLGTFGIAYSLRCFRNMPYFPSIVSKVMI